MSSLVGLSGEPSDRVVWLGRLVSCLVSSLVSSLVRLSGEQSGRVVW